MQSVVSIGYVSQDRKTSLKYIFYQSVEEHSLDLFESISARMQPTDQMSMDLV